jgi:hypothetical protein
MMGFGREVAASTHTGFEGSRFHRIRVGEVTVEPLERTNYDVVYNPSF